MKPPHIFIAFLFLPALLISNVHAQFSYFESWKNSSSANSVLGGAPNSSFLTSGRTVTLHGGTGYITEPAGDGFLRLTGADTTQAGYVYNNTVFPTDKGFKISFEYFTHGGNGGEGLCFFLFDAAGSVFNIGSGAGSLGYAQGTMNNVANPGVSNGFLGIALDEGGNFSKAAEGRQGGYSFPQSHSVVLRGSGNGAAQVASNYPYLTMTRTTFWNAAENPNPNFSLTSAAKREPNCANAAYRKVFIELKPKTLATGTGYDITVKVMVGGSTPAIYTVINNYQGFTTVSPAGLKYGISSVTSQKTNFHEIRNLSVLPYYKQDGSVNPEDYSTVACFNYTGGTGIATAPPGPVDSSLLKIPLDPNRWFLLNNNTYGLNALFDSVTSVKVNTGFGKLLDVYDAYYPVRDGEELNITGIKFYDGEGTYADTTTLYVITNQGQKIPIAWFTGSKYNSWVGPNPNSTLTTDSRFKFDSTIRNIKYLVLNIKSGLPTEMQVLGSMKAAPGHGIAVKKTVKLKEMLGINAFEWDFLGGGTFRSTEINPDKIKAMKTFAGIRHYMDWEKLEKAEESYTFNPTHSGGWNYDVVYERCKAEGIEVLACLKTIPVWMQNTYPSDQRDLENTPLRFGSDFSLPASYIEQAKIAFQYTARYGRNSNFPVGQLTVNSNPRWTNDPVNTVKKGLNLVKYIECDNERNKWWKGRKGYQTAFEYAANMSAFYDGHKNTMGPGVGVKNADSSMVVVIGGIAAATTEYVRGMIEWCRQNRGYKADGTVNLCWDIINYHNYPNDAASFQGSASTRGAAPEVTNTAAVAADFLQMAHEYANDMEVWVSETGYDVDQESTLKAIAVGNRSILETQADWILRTAFLYARAGIKRVFFYKTYDLAATGGLRFASMGFLNADQSRRPAADFIYQTNKQFGEYVYRQTLNSDPIVDRYEFNNKSAYMFVVPDEKGRTATYTLDLGTEADSAIIYTPTIGSDSMTTVKMATSNGKLAVTVTESPVFVMAATLTVSADLNSSAGARAAMPAPGEGQPSPEDEQEVPEPLSSMILGPNETQESSRPGETIRKENEEQTVIIKPIKAADKLPATNVSDKQAKLQAIAQDEANTNFQNLKVYPNPTSGMVRISFANLDNQHVEFAIFELNGRQKKCFVADKSSLIFSEAISLNELPNGIYVLEIRQGGKKSVIKIIKIAGAL